MSTFVEPLALTEEPSLPRTYVRCTEGPLVPSFAGFADRARSAPGWHLAEIATGHDAMVTRPDDVAALLRA